MTIAEVMASEARRPGSPGSPPSTSSITQREDLSVSRPAASISLSSGTPIGPASPTGALQGAETLAQTTTPPSPATAVAVKNPSDKDNMQFSDLYKSPRSPLSKLRTSQVSSQKHLPPAPPGWDSEIYADLLSKDKTKQKEAVKKYLTSKIRNDWEFPWPSRVVDPTCALKDEQIVETDAVEVVNHGYLEPGPVQDETQEQDDGYKVDSDEEHEAADSDCDVGSIYSVISEDDHLYRPRMEWTSDMSDSDVLPTSTSPLRFHGPDSIGQAIQAARENKRALRRRELRKEAEYNEGLRCFEARRDAWTGARTVRLRPKAPTPPSTSPKAKRLSFFRASPPSSPTPAAVPQGLSDGGSDSSSLAKSTDHESANNTTATSSCAPSQLKRQDSIDQTFPVQTILPTPAPLLPPQNLLRASITPSVYLSLYDKLILHNMQPACPVNLKDMLRACVAGWRRDGEWPPKSTIPPELGFATLAKRMSAVASAGGSKRTSMIVDNGEDKKSKRLSMSFLGKEKEKIDKPAKVEKEGRAEEEKKSRRLSMSFLGKEHENKRDKVEKDGEEEKKSKRLSMSFLGKDNDRLEKVERAEKEGDVAEQKKSRRLSRTFLVKDRTEKPDRVEKADKEGSSEEEKKRGFRKSLQKVLGISEASKA